MSNGYWVEIWSDREQGWETVGKVPTVRAARQLARSARFEGTVRIVGRGETRVLSMVQKTNASPQG